MPDAGLSDYIAENLAARQDEFVRRLASAGISDAAAEVEASLSVRLRIEGSQ